MSVLPESAFPRGMMPRIVSEQYFFIKLIPPRPTFAGDISPEEKALTQEHSRYTRAEFGSGFAADGTAARLC